MLVREVMSTQVIPVRADDTVADVALVLADQDVTALPVLDEVGRVAGVVGSIDIVTAATPTAHGHGGSARVQDVMRSPVASVHPDDDAVVAAAVMLESGTQYVPVIQNRHVVGIVGRGDLSHVLTARDDRLHADVQSLLDDAGLCRWAVTVDAGVVTLEGPTDGGGAGRAVRLAQSVTGVEEVRLARADRQARTTVRR